jgi:hypothetical protein
MFVSACKVTGEDALVKIIDRSDLPRPALRWVQRGVSERPLFALRREHMTTWSDMSPISVRPRMDGDLRMAGAEK